MQLRTVIQSSCPLLDSSSLCTYQDTCSSSPGEDGNLSLSLLLIPCTSPLLSYTESHVMLVWSLAVMLLQHHSIHVRDASFSSRLLGAVPDLLSHQHTSSQLFRAVTLGLEQLLLTFSLTKRERAFLTELAVNRCVCVCVSD